MHLCIFYFLIIYLFIYFLLLLLFFYFLYGDYLFAFIFQEFEILFKDIGGFEGLYRKMIACDIPTAVHLMWIPLSELKLRQQFSVILRFPRRFLTDQWNSEAALNARSWFFDTIKDTTDDLMTVIGFPVMELLVLLLNRVSLSSKLAIC